MNTKSYLTLALAVLLPSCGDAPSTNDKVAAATPSPNDRLAEVVKAYSDNAVQAKRTWGGKRLVLAGKFDSAGKNADDTLSILLNAGAMVGVAEFRFSREHEDFIAKLNKAQEVTLQCTVDPRNESMVTTFTDCSPA